MTRAAVVLALALLSPACHAQQYLPLIDESSRLAGQGRYAEAIQTAQRALKDAEDALGPEHPTVATALNNLAEFQLMAAFVSRDQARLEKAAADAGSLHQRALAIREKTLGLRHSFTLTSMVNLARTYSLERRYDDAETMYKRAQGVLNDIPSRAPVLVDLERQVAAGLGGIEKSRGR